MITCFIALGSNLEQPLAQVNRAIEEMDELPGSTVTSVSPWYRSTAIGPGKQPDYINGVAELHSQEEPLTLLHQLQDIENRHQRQRQTRWAARTLDLDLLLYGDNIVNETALTVPHPRMLERNFVLYPLFDIAPALTLPDGSLLKDHRDRCTTQGLCLIDPDLVDPSSCPTIAHAPYIAASDTTTAGDTL